ncbi:aldose 1-epimerase family protein [Aquipuribacter sp. MA13-6]|uniref:aldose epimerase family protein n=1 Tax=unclassified Aquipuribacter TaxID=2635084 RepID=UPI003EE8FB64
MSAPGLPRHVRLQAHGLTARIDPLGAALAHLDADGRDLVLGYPDGAARPAFAGSVLVPWPNRLGGGRYDVDGATYRTPTDDPDHDNAIHGLLDAVVSDVVDVHADRVRLRAVVPASAGYPSDLVVTLGYALERGRLVADVHVVNAGDRPAPYGVGTHPYLVAGDGPVDAWTLRLDASEVAELDRTSLPTGELDPVDGTLLDLREPRPLAGLELDHLLTAVTPGPDGDVVAQVRDGEGRGVAIGADASWARWWQVFTSDTVPGARFRAGVAVEPMSCPGDAFRSGTDLVLLAPGEEHAVRWWIGPLVP